MPLSLTEVGLGSEWYHFPAKTKSQATAITCWDIDAQEVQEAPKTEALVSDYRQFKYP